MGRVKDRINLLRKLSWRRTWNIVGVLVTYYLSRITRKPFTPPSPISISIEPTTSCNLRCPQCPSGLRQFSRDTGMLELDFFRKTVEELHARLLYLILYFQGEPYLNPRFFDMVRFAADRKLYVATSTNAHYLTPENARKTVESGLDRLIISMDGITQETYSKYRVGGKLDKVLEGIRNLVKAKEELNSATPYIVLQFIVFRHNEDEIPALKALAKGLKVDHLGLKTAQVYEDYEGAEDLLPSREAYSRYRLEDDMLLIKNKLLNHCWRMWSGAVVTWDGKVVPCCFDKDATHKMGDLARESFTSLWQGPVYDNFRGKILHSRKEIDICTNCTEGTRVWA